MLVAESDADKLAFSHYVQGSRSCAEVHETSIRAGVDAHTKRSQRRLDKHVNNTIDVSFKAWQKRVVYLYLLVLDERRKFLWQTWNKFSTTSVYTFGCTGLGST
jgi:hypothetical protein